MSHIKCEIHNMKNINISKNTCQMHIKSPVNAINASNASNASPKMGSLKKILKQLEKRPRNRGKWTKLHMLATAAAKQCLQISDSSRDPACSREH